MSTCIDHEFEEHVCKVEMPLLNLIFGIWPQTDIHTHASHNAVTLVWSSLTLAPISFIKCTVTDLRMIFVNIHCNVKFSSAIQYPQPSHSSTADNALSHLHVTIASELYMHEDIVQMYHT